MGSQSGTHCHTIYGRHDMAARQGSYDMLKSTRDRSLCGHISTQLMIVASYGGGYHTS